MEQFKAVLAEFESYGGTGIVFGGCLRDTLVGVGPIKDIDIAVKNSFATDEAIDRFVDADQDTIVHVQHLVYGNFPDVFKSVQVTRSGGVPVVNFVILSDDHPFNPRAVASRCDFGICQVAMVSGGSIYKTPAFIHDYRNYTFTYLREPFDEAQFSRSMRRFDRLTESKFEGWVLQVPGHDKASITQRQQFQNVPFAG